jgi:hypothetical protein
MIIAGIVLIIIGVILFVSRSFHQKKLFNIKATQTLKAKEIFDLCNSVRAEIGPGSFNKPLEVKGIIKCDNPLTAELSNQECVFYSMSVTREYEETYTDYDQNKRPVQRTRRGSETISNNSQSIQFYVEDETGKILVNPNGAAIDSIKSVDKFEPAGLDLDTISFGRFNMSLSSMMTGRRTLGYKYREEIVPLERRIYVLGEASDSSGELMVQKPKDKKESFVVSLKSEEELVGSVERVIKYTLIGGIAADVIGLALLIAGIVGKK